MEEQTTIVPDGLDPDASVEVPVDQFTALKGSLPLEIQSNPTIQNTKSFDSLAQQLINAQSMIGSMVKLPGADATDEDWTKFASKLGVPESPDGYQVPQENMPEGFAAEDPLVQSYLQEAHRLGIPPKAVAGSIRFMAKQMSDMREQAVEQQQNSLIEAEADLKKEWGTAYDERLGLAKSTYQRLLNEEDRATFESSGLANNPHVIKMIATFGKMISQDEIIGGGGGVSFQQTPEEAAAEIGRLHSDADFREAYTKSHHPGHAAAVERMKKLHEAAHPED